MAVAAAALALGACGTPATDVHTGAPTSGPAGGGAPSTASAASAAAPPSSPARPNAVGLPTLPPVAVRQPDRFDANGCVRTSPTASDCTQRSEQMDAAAAGSGPKDWRTLAGFVGKQYTADVSRGAIVVLTDTVTASAAAAGPWSAQGLVRNETSRTIAGVSVEATLLDAGGNVLEKVSAESPVTAIRAGEPVPFRLQAKEPAATAAAVASVTWRTVETPGAADPATRLLEITTYWTRPYADQRAVHMYLHEDKPGQVPAYLLFGSVLAHGAVRRPHVVLAWLDDAGRVVAVRDADVSDPGGAPAGALAAGTARDFLVAIDDAAEANAASNSAPMQWGVGR